MNNMFRIEIEDVDRRQSALSTILDQMDVPSFRKDTSSLSNLRWLSRNLSINNAEHPLHEVAKEMIMWLMKWHRSLAQAAKEN